MADDFETLREEMREVHQEYHDARKKFESQNRALDCPECGKTFSLYYSGDPMEISARCDHAHQIEAAYVEMRGSNDFD